jgi:hypothetical protein
MSDIKETKTSNVPPPPGSESANDSDTISISDSRLEKTTAIVPQALLKGAELVTEKGHIVTKDGVLISADGLFGGNLVKHDNPFLDPEVKAYYVDMYEKSQYECRHVFDAEFTWTDEEEKKLVRKLDWRGM